MVKFAKSIPLPQENDAALKTGIEFINDTARPVAAVPLEETVKQINSTTQL